MGLKAKNVKMLDVNDWDNLVSKTYGRPYSFQQQDGCKSRGVFKISIPVDLQFADDEDNEMHDSIPEVVNGSHRGVKFKTWLERDPNKSVNDHSGKTSDAKWMIDLFWDRNFYPSVYVVAKDLFEKGLIEEGDYVIDIDW